MPMVRLDRVARNSSSQEDWSSRDTSSRLWRPDLFDAGVRFRQLGWFRSTTFTTAVVLLGLLDGRNSVDPFDASIRARLKRPRKVPKLTNEAFPIRTPAAVEDHAGIV